MTNYYLQTLATAEPCGAGRLYVVFSDGFAAQIDLQPWIARGGIRAGLADSGLFHCVTVNEFGAPEWPGEIDLSPGTLRAWCEAGRVLTKEETDAWIEQHSEPTAKVA